LRLRERRIALGMRQPKLRQRWALRISNCPICRSLC